MQKRYTHDCGACHFLEQGPRNLRGQNRDGAADHRIERTEPVNIPKGWHQHKNGGGLVQDTSLVEDSVYISSDARVYGNARVYGDTWESSPLYIQGSKHSVTNSAMNRITIGCIDLSFEEWKEKFQKIGKENGYTDSEIMEYGKILELFFSIG